MLIIHLGEHHAIVVTQHPTEFDFDDLFAACNRITTLDGDLRTLEGLGVAVAFRRVRSALEVSGAPSMVPGDTVFIFPPDSIECRAAMRCDDFGWRLTPECFSTTLTKVVSGRHVIHALELVNES
jgi:hypothetical protein